MGKYKPIIVTANCGSLTRAGKILGYAQPNMGSIVTRFENELGVKIFHRSQHGVTLTQTGEKLIDIMRQIDDMEEHLQEISTRIRNERFRVGVFQSVASQWLPPIADTFLQENPNTVFQMEHLGRNLDCELGIQENRLDCAFFRGTNFPEGFQHVPLLAEPFYLLVPEDSPLAQASSLSLDDVAGNYPYIHTSEVFDQEDTFKAIQQKLMSHNVIKVTTSEDGAVISLVSQGLGICLVPKLSLAAITGDHRVKAIPLTDGPVRTISLLYPKQPENPALVSFFLRLLKDQIPSTDISS